MTIAEQIYRTLAGHLTEKLIDKGYYVLMQEDQLSDDDTQLHIVWANEEENKALMLAWDAELNVYELQINRSSYEPDLNDMDWEELDAVNYTNQELDVNDHDFAIEKLVHAYEQEIELGY